MRSSNTAKGTSGSVKAPKTNYDLTVDTTGWIDTGMLVTAGERVDCTATGQMTLSDGRVVGPDGLARGWKDLLRQFPLNSSNVGALVARISSDQGSVPLLVGTTSSLLMPTSGKLYLRANLSSDLSGSGGYKVKIRLVSKEITASDSNGVETKPVSALVSPATFADIPRRVGDLAGDKGDMVNYALLGTEAQVKADFLAAGYVAVDKTVEDAVLHGLLNTLEHRAYTEMPMSVLYLFGRPQDLSFARGDPLMVAAERHHVRLWKSDQMVGGKELWVGSCTHDIGFEKDDRNNGVTHKIDPNVDAERDFLLQSFDAAGVFSSAAYVTPANPLLTAHTATGGEFHSDGRIVVMELK